ncbi:hypothetical protein [Haloactinomyces albus]|uniref:Uncharacterized protein n=1 Tax=Haloactinomyces albus TaxID=1352928 RepID=A0AAE3ZAQ9_9ACTN|nr:hypothetical protein [Haloactinomyces albus]MDR7301443.1 hypothetical protein [Haloactinomyces albus]
MPDSAIFLLHRGRAAYLAADRPTVLSGSTYAGAPAANSPGRPAVLFVRLLLMRPEQVRGGHAQHVLTQVAQQTAQRVVASSRLGFIEETDPDRREIEEVGEQPTRSRLPGRGRYAPSRNDMFLRISGGLGGCLLNRHVLVIYRRRPPFNDRSRPPLHHGQRGNRDPASPLVASKAHRFS